MQRLTLVATLLLLLGNASSAAESARKVDPQYTWDLMELYSSVYEWNEAREKVLADLQKIDARRGTVGDSADALYRTLALISDTSRDALRVYAYASLASDEDLRVTDTQERKQLGDIMFARFTEATAWLQPEIIDTGREVIDSYLNEDERLQRFALQLDDALRNARYTLGHEAEETLAYFSQTFGSPNDIYSIVSNSDIPWPEVTLSDGEAHRIDSAGYDRWRASKNRDDRRKVFDAFWTKWLEYRNSVGSILNSHVQTQVSLARARNYDSVLERELFQDNLPPEVYRTLVAEVNRALPTLHRYFRLRGRILGIEQMHYYDPGSPFNRTDSAMVGWRARGPSLPGSRELGVAWATRHGAGGWR